jgi:hypothetical protein
MLYRVHRDAISFLGALAGFASWPLDPVPGFHSILEYRQSLRRVQASLPRNPSSLPCEEEHSSSREAPRGKGVYSGRDFQRPRLRQIREGHDVAEYEALTSP